MRLAYVLGLTSVILCAACGGKALPPPKPALAVAPKITKDVPKKAEPKQLAAPVFDLVAMAADAEKRVLPSDTHTDLVVRLRLEADKIPNVKRPPINLALVVDTSGSMAGDAIANARQACSEVIDKLADGDQILIVTFGSTSELLVPATIVKKGVAEKLKAKIATMKAHGTTAMAEGLQMAMTHLRQKLIKDGVNRVVLLGDGVPNNPDPLHNIAQRAGASGISITSLGLGVEYDETLMNAIAQRSGGTFHFIDHPTKVAAVFEKQVARLQRVVARNGILEIVPGPGVTVHRFIGMNTQRNGRSIRLNVGELSEGQERDVMVHLSLTGRRDGANIELLDAVYSYQDAAQDGSKREVRKFISLKTSNDEASLAEGRNPEIEHHATRFRVADLIVQAIATARAGDVKRARSILVDAEKLAKDGAARFEDTELAKKAEEAKKLQKTVASLAPPPPPARKWKGGGGRPRPEPAPMSPRQAFDVRSAHGAAMDVLNSEL